MQNDTWITPEQAIKILGPDWLNVDDGICVVNQYGVQTKWIRIFDGSEHELAKKGNVLEHVVMRFKHG